MKENKYDNPQFFNQYSQMSRSTEGLKGAGEWHELKKMLPDFNGKRLLDLGCGFGWHCRYAIEYGAISALGIDISEKMIEGARLRNNLPQIEYRQIAVEDYEYPSNSFEVVISSLTFHYLTSFDDICAKINRCLTDKGSFIFSVEHPIFTAYGTQDWIYGNDKERLHWPVDNYFYEGKRNANFLGEEVIKFHKTLTTYIQALLKNGFEITGLVEPQPQEEMLTTIEGMKDELRRPMMLIISANKK